MNFQLLLFDLDNTLLRTDAVEQFRGNLGLNPPPNYVHELTAQLAHVVPIYTYGMLHNIHTKYPQLKFGVFTRSPRAYTNTLLRAFYPKLPWDTVICFEDVPGRTKPHPDGIWMAMQATEVKDIRQVVMVGDNSKDIMAAYRAGVWAFLDRTSWTADNKDKWRSNDSIADADFRQPETLLDALENPSAHLPCLERLVYEGKDFEGHGRRIEVRHFDNVDRRPFVKVEVLGRRFKKCDEFQHRSSWHIVSQQIVALKEAQVFPWEWIFALRKAIRSDMNFMFQGHNVVTVIPSKPGQTPRLESLLMQLAASHAENPIFKASPSPFLPPPGPNKLLFVPDQLFYLNGVKSNSRDHLDGPARMINVRDHLRVNANRLVTGRNVMVIDDVTTSGATLLNAHHYLMAAGARTVKLVSMTQAISP